ncbi:MAG: glycosyltransferase [Chloroflexi bacterium]|nr:glycosyltransferase [Chloroflexota bacterium]
MKVCLITGEFPPMQGGVGDYTRCLAQALARRGCQVSVVTSTMGGDPGNDGDVRVLPVVSRWGLGCLPRLRRTLAGLRPDVVHIQYQAGAYEMRGAINLLPLLLYISRGPATAVTFHDLKVPYLFRKAGPLRQAAVSVMARTAGAVVTTNPEDAASLGRHSNLIPIGSNIPPVVPAGYNRTAQRARWGVGPGQLLLAYFGFLNPSKGVETLFLALHRLLSAGHPVTLLMVGGMASDSVPVDQAYAEDIRIGLTGSPLGDYVRWTGYISPVEVTANLLAADVCVLPFRDGVSFRNGTLAAAIAHGLALVTTWPRQVTPATAAAAVRSGLQLRDGVNARLVPPEDEANLVRVILELAGDSAQREELRRGAWQLARLLDWDTIAQQTMQVYEKLK